MNEYDVFMRIHADRAAATRAQRNQRFVEDLAAEQLARSSRLQRAFRATIQLIGKIVERRSVTPDDTACPTPPCAETPIRAS